MHRILGLVRLYNDLLIAQHTDDSLGDFPAVGGHRSCKLRERVLAVEVRSQTIYPLEDRRTGQFDLAAVGQDADAIGGLCVVGVVA